MSPLFYIQPLFVPLNKCWQKFTPKILSFIFHPSKRPTQHESRIYIIILSFRKGYYLRYKSCAVSLIAQQYQPTALLCQSDLIAYLGRTELSPLLGFPMQAGWPASCQESWLRWPLSYFSEKPHWWAWNRAFCTAAKIPRWSTPRSIWGFDVQKANFISHSFLPPMNYSKFSCILPTEILHAKGYNCWATYCFLAYSSQYSNVSFPISLWLISLFSHLSCLGFAPFK